MKNIGLMQVLCMYQHASAMTEHPVLKKEKIVSDSCTFFCTATLRNDFLSLRIDG
jgi:hypothetical protein